MARPIRQQIDKKKGRVVRSLFLVCELQLERIELMQSGLFLVLAGGLFFTVEFDLGIFLLFPGHGSILIRRIHTWASVLNVIDLGWCLGWALCRGKRRAVLRCHGGKSTIVVCG